MHDINSMCLGNVVWGFIGSWSFRHDLYMPRWQPDGDVVVHSSHHWIPCIKRSKLSGCSEFLKGVKRLCWCLHKSQVSLSIANSSGMGLLLKICWLNCVSPLYPKRPKSGGCVNCVLWAWWKWFLLCWRRCSSIISLSVTGIHWVGSSGEGIKSSEIPPGVDGCRICHTIEKQQWFFMACFNPSIRFFVFLFCGSCCLQEGVKKFPAFYLG